MFRYIVLMVAAFGTGALGQLSLAGECNYANISYVTNLNVTQMIGTWNQVARIDNPLETGDCSILAISGEYDSNGTLTSLRFYHSEIVNKTKHHMNGTITRNSVIDGIFYFVFNDSTQLEFVVQATNYTDYAILYSCNTTSPTSKLVYAWQYDRRASLTSAQQSTINEIIVANRDLNNSTWRITSHDSKLCTGAGTLPLPHILPILAILSIGKKFLL